MHFPSTGKLSLSLGGSNYSRKNIVITDIGDTEDEALICSTNLPNPGQSNWFLNTNKQYIDGVIQSDDPRGWRQSRSLDNGTIRLWRNANDTSWVEGLFSCTIEPDITIYVGIYYPSESHG